MYVYTMPPIDFGWELSKTVDELLRELTEEPPDYMTAEALLADYRKAKALARTCLWEGDFRESPRVISVPNENAFDVAFAFKQDNNGTTFIITPRRMRWLETMDGVDVITLDTPTD